MKLIEFNSLIISSIQHDTHMNKTTANMEAAFKSVR